jgi:hypothetical protein
VDMILGGNLKGCINLAQYFGIGVSGGSTGEDGMRETMIWCSEPLDVQQG